MSEESSRPPAPAAEWLPTGAANQQAMGRGDGGHGSEPSVLAAGDAPYRQLFEHSNEALAIVDAANTIRQVNRRFEQLAGRPRAVLEGRRIDEFLFPGPPVRIATATGERQALLGSSFSGSLFTLLQPEGEPAPVETTVSFLNDDQYLISVRDINGERLTERRLYGLWQLSVRLSASLNAPSVVRVLVEQVAALLDIEIFSVSLFDEQLARVQTVAERAGTPARAVLSFNNPTERRLALLPAVQRAVADAQPVYLEHCDLLRLAADDPAPEFRAQSAAPQTATASPITASPRGWAILVPMMARGRTWGVLYLADTRPERVFSRLEISICTAIAAQAATAMENARLFQEEVRAREEVAALRDDNQSILDSLTLGVCVIDAEGQVQFWNRALEQLFEVPRAAILGQPLFDRIEHLAPHAEKVRQIARTRQPYAIDRLSRQSEARGAVTESYRFQPLVRDGRLAGVLGVVEDLTLRVKMDSQLIRSERLAAVGELAAGVAHNFNNILAAIGGDAQLLKLVAEEQHLPREIIDSAELIYNETMRGGRIAHDLLSFARGQEPQIQVLDVRTVIADTMRLASNHEASKNVQIERLAEENLPRVEADPNQLHQVFFNMILNAMQAMPTGGKLTIAARVRAKDDDPAGGLLETKFTDTGCGISREQLKRIFDPFYSRRPNGGTGTGLGLTVSLSMVRAMGGDIQITSAEGIGTTVVVLLPIVERRTDQRGEAARHGKILVVDDEPNVRRTLSAFLARRGYQVHTAGDGEEAVKRVEHALKTQPYDLVVMDLMLPKIDGIGAISMIAARDPAARIVVVTGVTTPEKVQEALERGASFSFTKPLPFTGLGQVVDALIAERKAAGQNGPVAASPPRRSHG